MSATSICITILAHNEQQRIAACLNSIPHDLPGCMIHVVVNGSSDGTAHTARSLNKPNTVVHEFAEGGKARSWNRFVFDTLDMFADIHIFVDGDAELVCGSVPALVRTLTSDPHANLASAVPANGRKAAHYAARMIAEHGVFGDLYALKGRFLADMKHSGIRLPTDLIGDDGLLGALVKTNLQNESHWDNTRIQICTDAGFLCQPVRFSDPQTLRGQYKRMINYSVRHFQNKIISAVMRSTGPSGLPQQLALMYSEWLPQFEPRRDLSVWWFDVQALRRMRAAIAA